MVKIGTPFGTLYSDIDAGYGVAFGGEEEEEEETSKVIDFFTGSSWQDYSILGGSGGYAVLDKASWTANVPTLPDVPNPAPNRVLSVNPNNFDTVFWVSYPGDGLPHYPERKERFSVWIAEDSNIERGTPEFEFSFLFGVDSATETTIQDSYAATVTGNSVDNRTLQIRKITDGQDVDNDWDILDQQAGIEIPTETANGLDGWRRLVVDWFGSKKMVELRDHTDDVLASVSTSDSEYTLNNSKGTGFMARKISSSPEPFIGERRAFFQYAIANRIN